MATPYDTSLNGVNLTTTAYTDDTNYRDEWELQPEIESEIIHTLTNISTGKLMKPSTTNNNASVVVDSYGYNKTMLMWKFEYNNGFYRIKNDVTGLYLTAPTNNNENAVIMQTQSSATNSYTLWKITQISNGCYTIQSKNQYNRVTTTPLYLSVIDGSVVQSSSESVSTWSIKPLTIVHSKK